jgi:hypothetical protein
MFYLYDGETNFTYFYYKIMMMPIDYQLNSFFCASSLKEPSVCRHVTPFWNIIMVLSNQPLLFDHSDACLLEKQ